MFVHYLSVVLFMFQPYTVHSLLDDYKQRTNLERDIPRDLTEVWYLTLSHINIHAKHHPL